MNNLTQNLLAAKTLSDENLLSQLKHLAIEERKLTTQVLELLREVERRKLYCGLGFSSLFEYAVKELGYSEASASRRINSMRLIKDVPSAANSIAMGTLNLSTLSTVQCFLKREQRDRGKTYTVDEKQKLLAKMENRSARECEKILLQVSPQSAKSKETSRAVSPTQTELKVVVSDELMKKFEKIKGLLAHSQPSLSLSQLFEILADRTLEQIDPDRQNERRAQRDERKRAKAGTEQTPVLADAPSTPTSESSLKSRSKRFVPAAIRAAVWQRDEGQCTFVSPETGNKCESQFGLQVDHIVPVALGGASQLSNLRILCASHNTWEAIQKIGHSKMSRYIKDLR